MMEGGALVPLIVNWPGGTPDTVIDGRSFAARQHPLLVAFRRRSGLCEALPSLALLCYRNNYFIQC